MIAYVTYCNNDLLRLLSLDDRNAFTKLHSRYWKQLFAIVFSLLKERETAKDIARGLSRSVTVANVFELKLTGEVKFKTEGKKLSFHLKKICLCLTAL